MKYRARLHVHNDEDIFEMPDDATPEQLQQAAENAVTFYVDYEPAGMLPRTNGPLDKILGPVIARTLIDSGNQIAARNAVMLDWMERTEPMNRKPK